MPLSNSTNISFSPGNFTSSGPIGGQDALKGLNITNSSNYKWANKTAQLNLGNTNYGYVTFDISYTITGTADVVGISLVGPNMPISYSTTLGGLFQPLLNGDYIKLTAGVTKRIYVIVNATKKSDLLPITLIVGRKGTLPSNVTVNVQYNCTDVGPLYSYLMGLHVYSPYDAANNPPLKTYLYSYTPINSWTTNTELYASANFTQPAYPYYYSTGSYVYKVGEELERSFGEKKLIDVKKSWALGKTRKTERIIGPKSWKSLNIDGFITENFVYPTMNNVGKLRKILDISSLIQPSSYRYYMGAANNAQSAADFFTKFDFNNRAVYTITGFQHALDKLSRSFIHGYYRDLPYNFDQLTVPIAALGIAIADKFIGYGVSNPALIIDALIKFDVWIGSTSSASIGTGSAAGILGPFAISLITIAIVILVVVIILLLFNIPNATIEEPSLTWKYRYANTPYLNNGTRLYTNTTLTTYKPEYYCDGIYFYNHLTGSIISGKELSYSINALLSQQNIRKGIAYSVAVDTPDTGSIIYDFTKLVALPYCSGKPDTITGTNKNVAQSISFTPQTPCGDLLDIPATIIVSVPEGTFITTGSQALADSEATSYLNQLTSSYVSRSYGAPKTGSSGFGSYFTHEIKVETYPNTGSVFFDNTNGGGLTVGKYLYYDQAGCQKVFNGYYSTDSGSVSPYSHYKTFFKTSNGAVTDILSMASSVATTVTSLVNSATYPVQTANQGYISDWFWYQDNYNELNNDILYITKNTTNPNSLYTTSSLKSGFILPNTSSFYTYDSVSSTASYSEALPGFYYTFNSYENPYIFAYSTPITLSINLTEVCFTDYAVGEPYGVNISGATGSVSSSLYYPVNMTLNAYNGGSLITSFPATASAEGITYVDFPAPITKDSNVTNVTVASISSPNPNNKILYTAGTFTNCNPTTPSPTTSAPTTAAPTTAAPTTAAPTTAAPTTASPTTASPTTAAPTTAAPTPSAPPYSFLVTNGRLNSSLACSTTAYPNTLYSYDSDFSLADRFYSTNTYPYTPFDGEDKWYSNGIEAVQINSSGYPIDSITCPTPSPTAAPTTASPTTPPTPPPTTPPTTPQHHHQHLILQLLHLQLLQQLLLLLHLLHHHQPHHLHLLQHLHLVEIFTIHQYLQLILVILLLKLF